MRIVIGPARDPVDVDHGLLGGQVETPGCAPVGVLGERMGDASALNSQGIHEAPRSVEYRQRFRGVGQVFDFNGEGAFGRKKADVAGILRREQDDGFLVRGVFVAAGRLDQVSLAVGSKRPDDLLAVPVLGDGDVEFIDAVVVDVRGQPGPLERAGRRRRDRCPAGSPPVQPSGRA